MSSTSERVRAIVRELQTLGVRLWLDERGAHAEPVEMLTAEMRAELRELKSEIIEYLVEQGESIIDDDAVMTNNTPRRPAAEVAADAEKAQAAAAKRRSYQNGQVIVNGQNSMGRYMRLLREQREQAEARERGDIPPEGRYQTRWDLFNRGEYS